VQPINQNGCLKWHSKKNVEYIVKYTCVSQTGDWKCIILIYIKTHLHSLHRSSTNIHSKGSATAESGWPWCTRVLGPIDYAPKQQLLLHYTRLTALFPVLPGWAGTRKVKTNLDFTKARDSEWHWHQLGHMQVCTLLQADNHASTPPLSFLQARCPSCHPTNSVKTNTVITK